MSAGLQPPAAAYEKPDARLAGVIKGAETVEFYRKSREVHDGERPVWGDTAQSLGKGEPAAADVKAERRARGREAMRLRGVGG